MSKVSEQVGDVVEQAVQHADVQPFRNPTVNLEAITVCPSGVGQTDIDQDIGIGAVQNCDEKVGLRDRGDPCVHGFTQRNRGAEPLTFKGTSVMSVPSASTVIAPSDLMAEASSLASIW